MTLAFTSAETFRDDFSFSNSPAAIRRFPFPFHEDRYMYAVNVEPHVRGGANAAYDHLLDVDEHYLAECRERDLVLQRDPRRCQAMPHMISAEWDTVELIMETYAEEFPQLFSLHRDGDDWTWVNRPLGLSQKFKFGDRSTLPCGPLEYIARQAQGDFTLQDQRDQNLFMDAGMVTSQADWSLEFDLGMKFHEWHGPVPLAHELGVFDRALKYLLGLRIGQPVRRTNWTMTIYPRLDTSPEEYPSWGPDRTRVTHDNAGRLVHLRVEVQALYRLPRSNAILFSIRGYLISLAEIATVPKWARRLHRVLATLPPELVEYKGLSRYRDTAVAWLAAHDDGRSTSAGTAPE